MGVCICVCICACFHVCVHVCDCVCIHAFMCAYLCVCVCECVCVCVCVCVCMCVGVRMQQKILRNFLSVKFGENLSSRDYVSDFPRQFLTAFILQKIVVQRLCVGVAQILQNFGAP